MKGRLRVNYFKRRWWLAGAGLLSLAAVAWAGTGRLFTRPVPRAHEVAPVAKPWNFKQVHPQAEALLRSLQDTAEFNGVVLYARNGEILHCGPYGYARFSTHELLTTQTRFQLASVSKMFTAAAILLLAEDGLVHLDKPVQEYLSAFPYPDITIRHLLNHRSGLPRYEFMLEKKKKELVEANNAAILGALLEEQPGLWFPPGSKFNYGNINYALLGLIVEQVSGVSFAEFLQARIFKPLNMEHTGFYNRAWGVSEGMAMGYKHRRLGFYEVGPDFLDGVHGDKGIHSTVEDLFRFDQALYDGKIFKESTRNLLLSPPVSATGMEPYHLGWRLMPQRPGLMYHFGWWMGFRTCFIRDIPNKVTLIALSNRDRLSNPISYWTMYDRLNRILGPEISPMVVDSVGEPTL